MCVCVRACVHVCVLGQSQCCESTPFRPTLPIGVVERLSCLEGKVDDLQHTQNSQSAAIVDLQSGQLSLNAGIQGIQSRQDTQTTAIQDLQSGQNSQSTDIEDLRHEQDSLSQRMQEMETWSQGV